MQIGKKRIKMSRRRAVLGALGLVLALMLVVAACGEAATATPEPEEPAMEPTAMPEPTATAVPGQVVEATAEPEPAGPRPIDEWTADNPATFEEIEAALENYRGSSLNVVSWGGAYQAAQRNAYFLPFQERFGIQLVEDSPVEYAKIRSMVETGNVTWDVVDSGTRAVYQLGPDGRPRRADPRYPQPLPPLLPRSGDHSLEWWRRSALVHGSRLPEEQGRRALGRAISLKTGQHSGTPRHSREPGGWVAGWNENIFFAHFNRTPEILESSEGRNAIASLTEEQVDQSFEQLELIKPHIQFWWTAGTDCPAALLNDEADMCTAWNGRIWNVQIEEGGDNIHYCFECGHLNQTDVFYIPKGSPNKELAGAVHLLGLPSRTST